MIENLHLTVKRKANRLNTNHNANPLTAYMIDMLLDEATLVLIERFGFQSRRPAGFETTLQLTDMFGNLVEKGEQVIPTQLNDELYEVKLKNLKRDYYHLANITVDSETCNNITVIFKQHDDLQYALTDAFQRPSTKWRRVLLSFGSDSTVRTEKSLYLHVEKGTTLSKVYLDYIRRPRKVFIGGYDTIEYALCVKNNPLNPQGCSKFNNASSAKIESEVNEKYHYLLADVALELFASDKELINKLQIATNKQASLI